MQVRPGVYDPIGMERIELCLPVGEGASLKFGSLFRGKAQSENWVPPKMELHSEDEGKKLGYSDAPTVNSEALIFRPSVVAAMGDMLRQYGELLPLDCPGEDLVVYNVTRLIDALDEERSVLRRLESGVLYMIECPAFRPEVVEGVDIFKIPQMGAGTIYVSHRFVDLWQASKLHGLNFLNTADMTPGWWKRGGMSVVKS
jgi:hypothetical protein